MLLQLFILAQLANLGMCNSYFVFDNLVKRNSEDTKGAGHAGMDGEFYGCSLWIKNGDSVVSRVDAPSPPSTSPTTTTTHLIRTDIPDARKRNPTWFWTTCSWSALLIDWMGLRAVDGRTTWGANDSHAWCLSTDEERFGVWAGVPETNTEDWWPTPQYCYASMKLIHNGNVFGWKHIYPLVDRRELESVPKAADVVACEKDKAKTDAECDALVEHILEFQMKHEENLEVARQIPLNEDEFPRMWKAESEEEAESTEEEESSENRRRLMKL